MFICIEFAEFIVLLEAAVDDEVTVEERPLAFDVLKDSKLPRLVVQTARVLANESQFER